MQSDLFNLSVSNSFERQAFQRSFFEKKYTMRLDQLLGLSLVAVVFFVVVFAWGAEHGKAVSRRDFMLQTHASALTQKASLSESSVNKSDSVETAQVTPSVEVAAQVLSEVSSSPELLLNANEKALIVKPKYTIAHMTYIKKQQAMSELDRIKSKGFDPFIVSSGKYFQICVNGFDTRKSANETIISLRLQGIVSPDSYIRNMPH